MAEQEYEIRNKHMLVVSGVLGLLAVVLVNWHIYRIRQESAEDMVRVIAARTDILINEKLSTDNMEVTDIPRRLVPAERMGDVVTADDWYAVLNMEVNQDVTAQRILRWTYLSGGATRGGSSTMPKVGYRLVPIKVDRDICPPNLQTGMYVDMVTVLGETTSVGPPSGADRGSGKSVPIMEMVLVKAINDVGSPGVSMRNIDSVSVEIREADAAKLLAFKGTRLPISLLVRNPEDKPTLQGFNPDLDKLIRAAGGGGPAGPG